MKIVERKNIDLARWENLTNKQGGISLFAKAWYLDAVAENWCVLVNDDYSRGIALPYSKRAGVEVLYSPIFGRYSELIGEFKEDELALIKERFKVIEFACRQELFDKTEERIYQAISDFDSHKLGSQAKRSLKKAEKNGFSVALTDDYSNVFSKVKEELNHKFTGITEKSLGALEQLFENAKQAEAIKVFNVAGNGNLGGIVCFESKDQLLYVKGAVDSETKSNGGMYLALNTAIEYAKENNLKFDFGGSNVEGVKRFNYNLGGVDEVYFMHVQNNGPAWFKLAKRLKARLIDR
ncbi:MAG: hypothetical protein ACJASQ_003643 [Crocinitomicaceae bacterium]